MKVRFLGEDDPGYFLKGKVYTVVAKEGNLYRIIDETGEDYLYSLKYFEIVEGAENDIDKSDFGNESFGVKGDMEVRDGTGNSFYVDSDIYIKYT